MTKPSLARHIIARVCNERKNSDLRADNPDIIEALDEVLTAKEELIHAIESSNSFLSKEREKLEAKFEQSEVERTLLQNECARLRGVVQWCAEALFTKGFEHDSRRMMAARFPKVEGVKGANDA